ncbi:MAG: STAS domain-containing protein [Candidatus Omnitrophica bacterium]|nr:STAS domain-containing protein [Candidatus Omnitrophota bacterium]
MEINKEEKNGILTFRVKGDIDITSSPDVKKYFDTALTDKNTRIVISLKEVEYVDSSGLATLVEVLKRIRTLSGQMKLSDLSEKVKSLFEITKLDRLFDIV